MYNEDQFDKELDRLDQFIQNLSHLKTVLNRLLMFSHKGICVTNKNHAKQGESYYNLTLKQNLIELSEHYSSHITKTSLNVERGDLKKDDQSIAPFYLVELNTKVQSIIANLMESKAVLYRY
jgi:hypothetical protein